MVPVNSGPTLMELDVVYVMTALARIAVEHLEYQWQKKYWGCGLMGHVHARWPTNPSKSLSISALGEGVTRSKDLEKEIAQD